MSNPLPPPPGTSPAKKAYLSKWLTIGEIIEELFDSDFIPQASIRHREKTIEDLPIETEFTDNGDRNEPLWLQIRRTAVAATADNSESVLRELRKAGKPTNSPPGYTERAGMRGRMVR